MDTRPCIHGLDYLVVLKIKNSGLRVRVERDLREEFVATCRADGRTAAQVLRDCMWQFVERAKAGQQDLFQSSAGQAYLPSRFRTKKRNTARTATRKGLD